jgi:spermidine/putrescine transport system substrate-binding protein
MRQRSLTFGIRVLICGAWIAACLLFLWLPSIVEKFSSAQSITVLAWPTLIDSQKLQEFEKKTGIKVYLRYFESNEELYAKIKETKGTGYDLIMPSDYMVDIMKKDNLLKKIDKSKLSFFDDLYPHLVGNYFDSNNEFSLPYFWSVYGIAYDKNYFGESQPKPSWGLVFDPALSQKHTSMIDDARESILIASRYLFGSQASLTAEQINQIQKLLIDQKKWVEVYTEDRANYLLASKACPVAVILSAVVARVMRDFKNISFFVPEEGSFLVIDSFVMPVSTEKDELVYTFLNYMYQPEVISYYINKFGYFSPIKSLSNDNSIIPIPTEDQFKKIDFFKNIISKKQMSDLWINLKS